MEQNEFNPDFDQAEQNEETIEAVEETADDVVDTNDTPEELSDVETELAQARAEAKKATAEAAKFRRLFEKSKKTSPQVSTINKSPDTTTIEETVLKAQGLDAELLKELKAVASVRKIGLIEAQNDPVFQAIKSEKEKAERAEKARLGASKGSKTTTERKTISSSGLTDEEHKALFYERLGR